MKMLGVVKVLVTLAIILFVAIAGQKAVSSLGDPADSDVKCIGGEVEPVVGDIQPVETREIDFSGRKVTVLSPVLSTPGQIDTLSWRTPGPDINFGANSGDSLAVWFQAPGDLKVLAIRLQSLNWEGNVLFDIFETPYAGYGGRAVGSAGWMSGRTHPTGLTTPLGAHVTGPIPKTITDTEFYPEWSEVVVPTQPTFSAGDNFCVSVWTQPTAGHGFSVQYPCDTTHSFFKYYDSGPGPDGVHTGWFLRSYVLWCEVVVELTGGGPPAQDILSWRAPCPPVKLTTNTGDSLAVWFQAPADLKVLGLRLQSFNWEGNVLFDVFETPYSGYDGDAVESAGWLSGGTHPEGITSPLGAHVAGPIPKTISTIDLYPEWVEISLPSQPEFSAGDNFCASIWTDRTTGFGFSCEFPYGAPHSFFKYFNDCCGPDGVHTGWFLRQFVLWCEALVEFTGSPGEARVWGGQAQGAPGDSDVKVYVYLENDVPVTMISCAISESPDPNNYLRPIDMVPTGRATTVTSMSFGEYNNRADVSIGTFSYEPIPTGTGPVMEITYEIDSQAQAGKYDIAISEVQLTGISGQSLPARTGNGRFTVMCYYGINVVAGPDTAGAPGEIVPVTFTITNTGNVADYYPCWTQSSLGWTTEPNEFDLSLDPEQDSTIVIAVYIPTEVNPGDSSRIILNAFSMYEVGDRDTLFVYVSAEETKPNIVYVFNSIPPDGFNNCAKGYIWQQLGLLDTDGKPGTIPEGTCNIVVGGSTIENAVIRNGTREIIGYRSEDRKKEAYDVNSTATTEYAWTRVAENGTLHVIKHGTWKVLKNRQKLYGGGIHLDESEIYEGFGEGTGVNYQSGPYELPDRTGDNITIILNSCWSSKVPPGGISVAQSAETIGGVKKPVQGHVDKAGTWVNWEVTGENADQMRQQVETALKAKARAKGYSTPTTDEGGHPTTETTDRDVQRWISELSFDTQYNEVEGAIETKPGVTIQLQYGKKPPGGKFFSTKVSGYGYHHCPIQFEPEAGGETEYAPDSILRAGIEIPPGVLTDPTIFHLRQLPEFPAPLPPGCRLASGIFDFRHLEYEPDLLSPALITIAYVGNKDLIEMWRFNDASDNWVPAGGSPVFDTLNQTLTVDTWNIGIFAAFEPLCSAIVGDVNADTVINVLDAVALVNHILDIQALFTIEWSDCNGDGLINILDVLATINVLLGIIPECPGDPLPDTSLLTPEVMGFLKSLEPYFSPEDFTRFMALVKAQVNIPENYSLYQNYPNPFNPDTDIRYQISDSRSPVQTTLKIYNILGQEVRALVDEVKDAGYYTVTWDGKDRVGNDVASGIYFYRLTAGDFTATKRMVLLK